MKWASFLLRKQGEETQITTLRNERRDCTIDSVRNKQYWTTETFYTKKFSSFHGIDKFLTELQSLSSSKKDILKFPKSIEGIEFVLETIPQRKFWSFMTFLVHLTKH